MSKTMQYVYKGGIAVAALLASLMLLLNFMQLTVLNVTEGMNIFDFWGKDMEGAPTSLIIMLICYSAAFFLGFIVAVLAVLSIFVDNKILSLITKIAAIVLAVLAIVGLVCNFVVVGDGIFEAFDIGAAGIVSAIFSVATAGLIWAEKALVK